VGSSGQGEILVVGEGMAVPTAEYQIEFLRKLQRLLFEGAFVASYKFALLRAIADLAVKQGDDSDAPLRLSLDDISEQMIEVYWRQVRPYNEAGVLRQNSKGQAEIVSRLIKRSDDYDGSMAQFRADKRSWHSDRRRVSAVICIMPLWRLQRVGSGVDDFLYEQKTGRTGSVRYDPLYDRGVMDGLSAQGQ